MIEAISNIIISIVLGDIYGIVGIIAGTLISKACTRMWYEPYIIYKKIIKDKPLKFIKFNIVALLMTIILIGLCTLICGFSSKITWITLIIKMIVCTVVINGAIYVLVHPLEEYKYLEKKFLKKNK